MKSSLWRIPFYGLLLGLLYHPALAYLLKQWHREDFNYGYIILPVVLFLVWEKRAELKRLPSAPSWIGLIPVVVGLAAYALGELGGEYTILFLSLWLVVVGLAWLHLGWEKLKTIAFPLGFLLVMFPPPHLIYSNLSLRLQLVSSRLGVAMLQAVGMPAYREGNVIDLGFTTLQVVEACSGLRYLFPLVAMAALLAYQFRTGLWKGIALVLSAIPVTIATNSLRIASTGVLYRFWGAKVAEGFFHDFSGWLIFMFGLAILLGELWLLNRLSAPAFLPKEPVRDAVREPLPNLDMTAKELFGGFGMRPGMPQSLAAAALLLATLLLFRGIDFREKVPVSKPLSLFPLEMGEWRGIPYPLEPGLLEALNLSDHLSVAFQDPQGRGIDAYVAYNDSQSKGKSSHSPDSCLPGSGWVFRESGMAGIDYDAGGPRTIRVKRAVMEKDGARQIAYYWFPQRGRILTNMYQLKAYAFWDALTRQRTDGALVRLITPVYDSERIGDAEERLRRFARRFVPVLEEFLPGRERR
jgi:exosortase D (VPLPA-CTERM-specific)